MRFSRCFSALFLGPLLWATVPAPAVFAQSAVPMASGYRQPPADILQILDAPVTPTASFSPDRRYMLLTDYQAYPPIALLARPYKKLAGLRVDPALNGTQRIRRYTGITIQNVADGKKVPLMGLPKDAAISPRYGKRYRDLGRRCGERNGQTAQKPARLGCAVRPVRLDE
jgi:hypothetical protein